MIRRLYLETLQTRAVDDDHMPAAGDELRHLRRRADGAAAHLDHRDHVVTALLNST